MMCATTHKPHKHHRMNKRNTKNIERWHNGDTSVVYTVNDSSLRRLYG